MDYNSLMPQPSQPVNRSTTGQLPSLLIELSEEALSQLGADASFRDASGSASVLASTTTSTGGFACICSYDGDDAE